MGKQENLTLSKKSFKQNPVFRWVCIVLAVLIVVLTSTTTPPEGLSPEGWGMLGICIGAMILFISEAVPMIVVCMMVVVAMVFTGNSTFKDVQKNAGSSSVFFIMAGFGLGAALQNTNWAAILLRAIYRLGKGKAKAMVAAALWMSAIISVFVSNGTAQVVTVAVVISIIEACGIKEPGSSRFAAAMMIAVPIGAMSGGLFLPCSNVVNVAIMELSEGISGHTMTFFEWAIFGVPLGLLVTFFATWRINKYFKPEELTEEQKANIEKVFETIPQKLTKQDLAYMVIVAIMMVLWIVGNWISVFDAATVAMAGLFLMMVPGMDLMTVKDYKKAFSAPTVICLLCLMPFAKAISNSGLGEWVAGKLFAGAGSWGSIPLYIMAAITSIVIHFLVPQGSANAVLAATVIAPITYAAGIPVIPILILVGLMCGTSFTFPIESSWQYTFGHGYYSFSDVPKCCWMLLLFVIILSCTVVPGLGGLYGAIGLI